jgi:hypothetical protein
MKAKELRIGNYVNYGFIGNEKYLSIITGLHKDDIVSEVIEPIPLTEDWLLKFGFAYNKTYQIFDNDTISIMKLEDLYYLTADWYHIFYEGFKHVHQLQNLYFALTGKELEIK